MLLNSKYSRVIIAPMDKSQTLYEVAYLISPAYSEEEARSFHQSIKDGAQNAGGLIEHDGDVTKKRLAYPVKKMTEAYLASFLMLLDSDKLATLKSVRGRDIKNIGGFAAGIQHRGDRQKIRRNLRQIKKYEFKQSIFNRKFDPRPGITLAAIRAGGREFRISHQQNVERERRLSAKTGRIS